MKVRIEYSDGQYSMVPLAEDSPHEGMYITDEMWTRYQAFTRDAEFWSEILRAFDNVTYLNRVLKERDELEDQTRGRAAERP